MLRRSFNAIVCGSLRLLQEFHLAREWFYKLPDADVPVVYAVYATAAYVHLRDRDRDRASTSNPIELSNPNAFCGGKEC
jgi:hypothetical protein